MRSAVASAIQGTQLSAMEAGMGRSITCSTRPSSTSSETGAKASEASTPLLAHQTSRSSRPDACTTPRLRTSLECKTAACAALNTRVDNCCWHASRGWKGGCATLQQTFISAFSIEKTKRSCDPEATPPTCASARRWRSAAPRPHSTCCT